MSPQQGLSDRFAGIRIDCAVAIGQVCTEKFVRVQVTIGPSVACDQMLSCLDSALSPPIGLRVVGAGDPQSHTPPLEPLPDLMRSEVLASQDSSSGTPMAPNSTLRHLISFVDVLFPGGKWQVLFHPLYLST